jgi:hypothetical protein
MNSSSVVTTKNVGTMCFTRRPPHRNSCSRINVLANPPPPPAQLKINAADSQKDSRAIFVLETQQGQYKLQFNIFVSRRLISERNVSRVL